MTEPLGVGCGHGKPSHEILRRHPRARVTVSDLDPTSAANIAESRRAVVLA
ncbi:class I SAM-dependent methyltransferase [Mycobacterium dioxanotrophicus]|uniref:class I SAM-dependent methyltransferase n=1 Tax=Mycobacterium dioxanotrophicus TaxID=482462 RepID=UPI0012F84187|nr:class I SAM-dependent methyltransferase [Mycobacterium dioxanotrophicus]